RDWLLEDRCLMSADPMVPALSNKPLDKIFWNGGPWQGDNPPPTSFIPNITAAPTTRTITITNTTDQSNYPILRGANVGKDPHNTNHTVNPADWYDPQDYHNQEYRAYIGYQNGSGQFLGLPAHSSIEIRVPLVFWDSENTYIVTDGRNLLKSLARGTALM